MLLKNKLFISYMLKSNLCFSLTQDAYIWCMCFAVFIMLKNHCRLFWKLSWFVFFGGTGFWTRGFTLARWVLWKLSELFQH
jgi:hypothetical protein